MVKQVKCQKCRKAIIIADLDRVSDVIDRKENICETCKKKTSAMSKEIPIDERNKLYESLETFFMKKEYDYLFLILDHTITKYPQSKELIGWKIKVLIKTKQFNEAMKLCNELLKHDKNNSMIYFWKGKIYDIRKREDLADKNFTIARKLNPTHNYNSEFPLIEKRLIDTGHLTVQELKVHMYFTNPEKLPEIDKQLCELFMSGDPRTRNALRKEYPEMYKAFIKSERGIYKILKGEDIIEASRK